MLSKCTKKIFKEVQFLSEILKFKGVIFIDNARVSSASGKYYINYKKST